MRLVFSRHIGWLILGAIIIAAGAIFLVQQNRSSETEWVTTIVEQGTIEETVSVSGTIKAVSKAELGFPAVGRVTEVFVSEGDTVLQGQVLATLASTQLVAQRNEATAALESARAAYDALLAGPTELSRNVTETTVANAQQNLQRVITFEQEKVDNARQALLSNDLEALAVNQNANAQAPTITGAYTCGNEGTYTIEVYQSGGVSGYSYRTTGLEQTSAAASFNQPQPLGSCGLYIQFASGSVYSSTEWTIQIPNTRSDTYTSLKNAYELALKNKDSAVQAAEDALELAQTEANLAVAQPRNEDVRTSTANIEQARASIAAIDAQIADRSIVAPFDGTITDVNILAGETAPTTPVITILGEDAFELHARIPEIDITKVLDEQRIRAVFDAQPSQTLIGTISYISPLATEIDGVAYFETTITLDEQPPWMRSGLNADVDIVIGRVENALRIPKRFVITNPDRTYSVLIPQNGKLVEKPITVGFAGNDGYVEVTGVTAGDTVVSP